MFARFASPSWVHFPGGAAEALGTATRTQAQRASKAVRIGMARDPNRARSVRVECEHAFVENPNVKGNIAELEIALAAERAGIVTYKPIGEHGRADLLMEIGGELYRVQCKWGRLDRDGDVIVIGVESNRCTPNGYVRTRYERAEVELLATYCDAVDRCYLLPQS